MSKLHLLQSSHLAAPIHRRTFAAILSAASKPLHVPSSISRLHFRCQFSLSLRPNLPNSPPSSLREPSRKFLVRAFDSSSEETKKTEGEQEEEQEKDGNESGSEVRVSSERVRKSEEDYPSGEFQFEKPGAWKSFVVKLRMLVAFPWERVRKGSVLTMKLRGQVFFLHFLFEKLFFFR